MTVKVKEITNRRIIESGARLFPDPLTVHSLLRSLAGYTNHSVSAQCIGAFVFLIGEENAPVVF